MERIINNLFRVATLTIYHLYAIGAIFGAKIQIHFENGIFLVFSNTVTQQLDFEFEFRQVNQ